MKLLSLITSFTLSIALIATPLAAKEHNGERSKSSRHVVVSGSSHHSHSKNHHSTRSHKRHYSKKHHSYNHKRHHRSHNIATAIIAGAALHHAYGIHGSHHNGHAWCPTHRIYHTHSYGAYGSHYNGHAWCPTHTVYHTHSVSYSHHNYNDNRRKVDSYVEEDEGRCFRVTEYSNGDERRKRIRDHHCDEWE